MPLTDISSLVTKIIELQDKDKAEMESDIDARRNSVKNINSAPVKQQHNL